MGHVLSDSSEINFIVHLAITWLGTKQTMGGTGDEWHSRICLSGPSPLLFPACHCSKKRIPSMEEHSILEVYIFQSQSLQSKQDFPRRYL